MENLKEIFSNKKFLIIGCSSILVILIAILIIVLVSGGEDKEKENSNTTTTTTELIETETSITLKDDKTNVEVVYTGKEDLKETLKVSEFEISKELKKQNIIKVYDIKVFDENNQELTNKENILIKIPFDNETTKYNSFIATKIVNNEMTNSIDAYYDETNKVVYFYTNDLGTYGIVAKKVADKDITTTKKITTIRKATTTKKSDVTDKNTITSNNSQENNNKRKVIFTLWGGKNYKTVEVENNTKVNKPANPTYNNGEIFKHWIVCSTNKEFDFNTLITKDYELCAVTYREEHTATTETTTKATTAVDKDAPTGAYVITVKNKNGETVAKENVWTSVRIKLNSTDYFNSRFSVSGGFDISGIEKYEIYMDYGPVVYIADNSTSILSRNQDRVYHLCGVGGTTYVIYAYDEKGNKSEPVKVNFCIDEPVENYTN